MTSRIKSIFAATLVALAAFFFISTTASADVIGSGGGWGDGTASGTITSATYGENGLESVVFTAENGSEYTISNGVYNDIDQFGSLLGLAFLNGLPVTLTSDMGDLKKVTLRRPVEEAEQSQQSSTVPG